MSGKPKPRVKHTYTVETSAVISMADLAQLALEDRFDPTARFELHLHTAKGGGKVEEPLELMVTQFVRREQHPMPEKPAAPAEDVNP